MKTQMKNLFIAFCTFALMAGMMIAIIGCTQQQRAKGWGGTATINLPAGEQLVTATWKETHLWYLTTKRPTNVPPRTYTFKESSSFGMVEGTVIIQEH